MAFRNSATRQFVGALCLFLGMVIFGMALFEATELGGHIRLPATWYTNRPLWLLIAAGLFAMGWNLQWPTTARAAENWKPVRSGPRFERVVIYSREDCHLCDDAKEILGHYADVLPEIEDVDIDEDPHLQELFGDNVPVVEIDGQVRFRGRVDEVLLRRLIDGAAGEPH